MKIQRVVSLLLLLGLTACSSWSTSSVNNQSGDMRVAKSPSQVKISEGDSSRPYTSLGDISVTLNKTTIFNEDPTREGVNQKLREKAAEMGADAVILVRYGTVGMSMMSWGSLDGNGRAIVFK